MANNKEFNAACVDLNNALEYRKTHPLEGGVIRETIKISDTNHVIKEIPYKVLGDELVADGTCILNFVDEQYKNANGDWYKMNCISFIFSFIYPYSLPLAPQGQMHRKGTKNRITCIPTWNQLY